MGRRTLCFRVHLNLAPNRTTLHIRQSIRFGSNLPRCTKELELQDYLMARCWTTRGLGTRLRRTSQLLALIFFLCVPEKIVFIFGLLLYCMPLLVSSPATIADVPSCRSPHVSILLDIQRFRSRHTGHKASAASC